MTAPSADATLKCGICTSSYCASGQKEKVFIWDFKNSAKATLTFLQIFWSCLVLYCRRRQLIMIELRPDMAIDDMPDAKLVHRLGSHRALIPRLAGFFVLWLVLMGTEPKHWPFGIVAASAATFASACLWPSSTGLSPSGVVRFMLRFLPQSVTAGLDVARRAFSPDPGLHPGIAAHETALPPGMARDGMTAVMSLQPGKLPVGSAEKGMLLVHCLDMKQPVAAGMAADEVAYRDMFRERGHG